MSRHSEPVGSRLEMVLDGIYACKLVPVSDKRFIAKQVSVAALFGQSQGGDTTRSTLRNYERYLEIVGEEASLAQKPSVTKAKELLRTWGDEGKRLASKLGSFSKGRNWCAHPEDFESCIRNAAAAARVLVRATAVGEMDTKTEPTKSDESISGAERFDIASSSDDVHECKERWADLIDSSGDSADEVEAIKAVDGDPVGGIEVSWEVNATTKEIKVAKQHATVFAGERGSGMHSSLTWRPKPLLQRADNSVTARSVCDEVIVGDSTEAAAAEVTADSDEDSECGSIEKTGIQKEGIGDDSANTKTFNNFILASAHDYDAKQAIAADILVHCNSLDNGSNAGAALSDQAFDICSGFDLSEDINRDGLDASLTELRQALANLGTQSQRTKVISLCGKLANRAP